MIGVPSVTWLGVPLRAEGRTVGAMVVQSFRDDVHHTEQDEELLDVRRPTTSARPSVAPGRSRRRGSATPSSR